ncbi:DinB family protein [Poriferisphaera sp. WC338]|uniref:DinB family protein n=1 Tax=Poriferisphaera sp. WC338 TaxID=3425129 RepID=UPI003D81665A
MSLSQSFSMEFEKEIETTRRFLNNLPADQLDWKPHEKSLTAGQLALHIASIPTFIIEFVSNDTFTVPDFSTSAPAQPESYQQIMQALDQSIEDFNNVLPTLTDDFLASHWAVVDDKENELFSIPRAGAYRSLLFNHLYHHRGQLGVYLRLLGTTVPSCYGPSGDELPAWAPASAAN